MPHRTPKRPQITHQLARSIATSCAQKHAYPTKQQAVQAAEVQMLSNMQLHLAVYECTLCRKWHLTRRSSL